MRSTWRTLAATLDRATLGDIGLVCLADALVGMSFGAIAVSGGLPAWQPVVMSLVVFAGGAQFAAVAAVLAGGSATAGVVAGLVLNARLLPFGVAVADVLDGRWSTRLVGAHVMTDESVAFAVRHTDPAQRRAAYWACGIGLFVCWNVAVVIGALAGQVLSDTDALGLDAAFPAVLLALVLPAMGRRSTRNAALLGAAIAVAATFVLPPGLSVLTALLGLVAVGSRRREEEPA